MKSLINAFVNGAKNGTIFILANFTGFDLSGLETAHSEMPLFRKNWQGASFLSA
jgi:hypothetical protein